MFGDPIVVFKNGVSNSLPRVSVGVNSGAFQKADGALRVDVSHQYGKRIRRQLRLTDNKIAVDPLTADNLSVSQSVYLVTDTPKVGFSLLETQASVDSLLAYLSGGSDAAIIKLLGGEA